jgi:hypothetical protein
MRTGLAIPDRLHRTGQRLVRTTIAAYFLAIALGLLPGTGIDALTSLLLPEPAAGLLGTAISTMLAGLIVAGRHVRAAALSLSTLLFWSSYVNMLQLGPSNWLGHFWRDLALLAALLLTSSGSRGLSGLLPAVAKRNDAGRVVGRVLPAREELPESSPPLWKSSRLQAPRHDESTDGIDNIFAAV